MPRRLERFTGGGQNEGVAGADALAVELAFAFEDEEDAEASGGLGAVVDAEELVLRHAERRLVGVEFSAVSARSQPRPRCACSVRSGSRATRR